MLRKALVQYLDSYLDIPNIKDYGPQGLQVEAANSEIKRIALTVDVAPDIIETAADWNADMLLVHHGVFWGATQRIAGPLGARVRAFMQHGINLYAAHLPLDAHAEVGNNAVLAQLADIESVSWWANPMGTPLGTYGALTKPIALSTFVDKINDGLDTESRVLANGPETVRNVAILSGFGADRVEEAKALGADTYLTGEMSHANFWAASDHGLNVIFAGHYATETVGVKALGEHLETKFDLETRFFDFPTGM